MADAPGKAMTAGRAYALDALRGLAMLAMLLSGQLPFGHGALPAWMYHAQEPPPHHAWLGKAPGLTWVDLVFPTFLFCMGAAFPLAFSRRMDQGQPKWRLGLFILERGFLLGFFALYVAAIRPYNLHVGPILDNGVGSDPGAKEWLLGLLGFFLLFPVLTRLPEAWAEQTKWLVKVIGWAAATLFLSLAPYSDGQGFSYGRSDIIIIVLTNMAVFGSLAWMVTRHELLPRLGILGIIIALRVAVGAQPTSGWVSAVWHFSPAHWIYQFTYLQYLCIVIPGTIAGDMILRWSRAGQNVVADDTDGKSWPAGRFLAIAGLMFAFVLVLLIGLETRVPATDLSVANPPVHATPTFMIDEVQYMRPWLLPATLLTFAMCGAGWLLLRRPGNETERLYQQLFQWATYWLVLGLACEPFEAGIKKDHPTLSYYFITAGLAHCMFIGLSIMIDHFKRRRWLQFLIDNGQNPMIAYAGINNFITPLLMLTGGMNWLMHVTGGSPWLGFLRGLIITLLMAATVSFFNAAKNFLANLRQWLIPIKMPDAALF